MKIMIPLRINEKPRQCLPCGLCCKLYNVKLTETVTKVKDSWCPYAVKGCGCSIYERRPEPCSSFRCAWLENQLPEWAKPDKIHGVVQLADGGKLLILHEDPGYPGAASYSLREVIKRYLYTNYQFVVIVICGERYNVHLSDQQLQGETADKYLEERFGENNEKLDMALGGSSNVNRG